MVVSKPFRRVLEPGVIALDYGRSILSAVCHLWLLAISTMFANAAIRDGRQLGSLALQQPVVRTKQLNSVLPSLLHTYKFALSGLKGRTASAPACRGQY